MFAKQLIVYLFIDVVLMKLLFVYKCIVFIKFSLLA